MNNQTLPNPILRIDERQPEVDSVIRAHFQPFLVALSLATLAAGCTAGTNDSSEAEVEADAGSGDNGDDGDNGDNGDNGSNPPEVGPCGDLAEGQGECTGGLDADICEEGERVQYECPVGSLCAENFSEDSGIGCDCDNVADDYCPSEACSDDPDCDEEAPLSACAAAEATYPLVMDLAASEANANNPMAHFLAIRGNLNHDPMPDRLVIGGFYQFGLDVGTFDYAQAASPWTVNLVMDQSSGFPSNAGVLELQSGTLIIESLEGDFRGFLQNAVFVDDKDNPTCQVHVSSFGFDEPITCTQNSDDCIN